MAGKITRREALLLGTAGISYALLPNLPAFSYEESNTEFDSKIVARYGLGPVPRDVDIDRIARGLETSEPIKQSDYVPDFLNLIQATRKKISGFTVNQGMNYRLGRTGPIEVVLVEGLLENWKLVGKFIHNDESDGINTAYIDADRIPSEFLGALSHEFFHAEHGVGEVKAYVNENRELATLTALYPDLRKLPEKFDPLTQYIGSFDGVIKVKDDKVESMKGNALYLGYLIYKAITDDLKNITLDSLAIELNNPKRGPETDELSRAMLFVGLGESLLLNNAGKFISRLTMHHIVSNSVNLTKEEWGSLEERIVRPDLEVVKFV